MQNVISGQGQARRRVCLPLLICRIRLPVGEHRPGFGDRRALGAADGCISAAESTVRVSATGGAMTRLDVPILGFFLDRGERMGYNRTNCI